MCETGGFGLSLVQRAICRAGQRLTILSLLLAANLASAVQPESQPAPPSSDVSPAAQATPTEAAQTPAPTRENEEAPAHAEAAETNELADLSIEELMDVVVVTATRREQNIKTVPYAVSVITAEDIRRSGMRTIPDALRLVPGVDVAQLGYANVAVSVRGLNGLFAHQTLVLVDGRQIYDGLFGGTLWNSFPLSVEDIERIEVVRGPGGVTWGPDAVNGVINIITKNPVDQQGLTLHLNAGSRGTHKEYLGYGSREDDWSYRVSGEYEMTDGFRQGGSWASPLDDDFLAARLAAKGMRQNAGDGVLTLSLGSAVTNGGSSPGPFVGGAERMATTQSSYFLGEWLRDWPDEKTLHLRSYINDVYMDIGRGGTEYRYQQIGFLMDRGLPAGQNHTLSYGLDTRLDFFDATNADRRLLTRSRVTSGRFGAYLQSEWAFRDRWMLSSGVRSDYDSYGGFEPSARMALSRQLTDDSLFYASISRASHVPPAPLRFLNTYVAGPLVRSTADRELRANSLVGYEIGYRGKLGPRFDHSAAVYWHEYNDIAELHPRLGPPGLFQLQIDNGVDTSSYGFEWEGRFRATDRWTLLGNYTYEQMDDGFTAPMQVSSDLISSPEHKFMIGTQYAATDDLHFSTYLFYVDDVRSPNPSFPISTKRIDDYFRLDVRAEHDLWKDSASIAVGVRNLLDQDHPEGASSYINSAEVPRMFYVEFRATIK